MERSMRRGRSSASVGSLACIAASSLVLGNVRPSDDNPAPAPPPARSPRPISSSLSLLPRSII